MIRYLMFCTVVLLAGSSAAAQPQGSEPLLEKLEHILGIDKSTRNLKGPQGSGSGEPGEIWISPADQREPRRLVAGDRFRSPVFQPGEKYLYALQDSELIRISLPNGLSTQVRRLPNVIKLVGFDGDHPDQLLAIFEASSNQVDIALVSVSSGTRKVIAARQSRNDSEIENLLGWGRRYGDVYVLSEGRNVIISGISPVDLNVSDCGKDLCSQPSFSPELRQVAFIRSAAQ